MKEIDCPCCHAQIKMDETLLNSGQDCTCPKCSGTFAKANKAKPDDDQFEIKTMGNTAKP